MFKIDVRRIKVCIEFDDYSSAKCYARLIKDNYEIKEEKYWFEEIIKMVSKGDYEGVRKQVRTNKKIMQ